MSEKGVLTNWRTQMMKGHVRIWNESEWARGTHLLESEVGASLEVSTWKSLSK